VFPSLLTVSAWLNHRILTDEVVASRAVEQIVDYVMAEGYDGFDLDLEGISATDRDAFTAFVARLGAALHERGKTLAPAIPAKDHDATTGWAGAYDYAALGEHADLITIMTYDFRGAWSGPGSVAPYDWVDRVMAFATSQIPAHKVLLGLAFYGYDWNVTAGSTRALGHAQAAALAERYQAPITLDPATQSATFRYQAPAGDPPPTRPELPRPQHEITERVPPPCPVEAPTPAPTPTARPTPLPDAIQDHEVWLEESGSAAARLGLADRHRTGGVAAWRLGLEDPQVWAIVQRWRQGAR
jgi:spore germination protein